MLKSTGIGAALEEASSDEDNIIMLWCDEADSTMARTGLSRHSRPLPAASYSGGEIDPHQMQIQGVIKENVRKKN